MKCFSGSHPLKHSIQIRVASLMVTLSKKLCRILQIRKSRTTLYHPQCDSLVERFNQTLLSMLATSTKDKPLNWEQYIRPVCFAYNTSIHTSTGFTPFYLMYGREAHLPVDLEFGVTSPSPDDLSPVAYSRQMQIILSYAYRKVCAALGDVQRRQKMLYDRNIHSHPYKEGDMVWLHSTVVPPHIVIASYTILGLVHTKLSLNSQILIIKLHQ